MAQQFQYNQLRGRIIAKYGSQNRFAEVLGLSKNSVSKKMSGTSGFSQKDIETWAELLDIDPADYGEYFFT